MRSGNSDRMRKENGELRVFSCLSGNVGIFLLRFSTLSELVVDPTKCPTELLRESVIVGAEAAVMASVRPHR